MNDFQHEVAERKSLARGSRAKKRGSKSKKCSLPSDGMTQKEWRDRCSEIGSWKMTDPLRWDQFYPMPDDLKKEYLDGLVSRYGVAMTDIATMFGQEYKDISRLCKRLKVSGFQRGRRMNDAQLLHFHRFLSAREEKLELCDKDGNPVEPPAPEEPQPERSYRVKEMVFTCESLSDAKKAVKELKESASNRTISHFEVKVVFDP